MDARDAENCTAFLDAKKIAEGAPIEVALAARSALEGQPGAALHVFDDSTAQALEFDLRGTDDDVRARFGAREARRPGRPRLGVIAREVTLLPRHWDWLATQPGGASAVLRRLVDGARADREGSDRARAAQDVAYRFMSAALGDHPGFEEASRALFACDRKRFAELTAAWPADLADFARRLAGPAFASAAAALRAADA